MISLTIAPDRALDLGSTVRWSGHEALVVARWKPRYESWRYDLRIGRRVVQDVGGGAVALLRGPGPDWRPVR